MHKEEIDRFLNQKLVARVATIREDGYPHVTPLWYYWDGKYLYLILGSGARPRQHIANLRRDPKVTVCIDRDTRPEAGPKRDPGLRGAQAVVIRGRAELSVDEKTQVDVTRKVLGRYGFGAYVDTALEDGKPGKNRVVTKIKPEKIIAWNFEKYAKVYKAQK